MLKLLRNFFANSNTEICTHFPLLYISLIHFEVTRKNGFWSQIDQSVVPFFLRSSLEVLPILKREERDLFRIFTYNIHAEFQRLVKQIQLEKAEKLKIRFWSMTSKWTKIVSRFSRELQPLSESGRCTIFCIAIYDTWAKSQLLIRQSQRKGV